MAYVLKTEEKDLYLPKTPYLESEIHNHYLTADIKRRAEFKHRKVAENRLRDLQDYYIAEGYPLTILTI